MKLRRIEIQKPSSKVVAVQQSNNHDQQDQQQPRTRSPRGFGGARKIDDSSTVAPVAAPAAAAAVSRNDDETQQQQAHWAWEDDEDDDFQPQEPEKELVPRPLFAPSAAAAATALVRKPMNDDDDYDDQDDNNNGRAAGMNLRKAVALSPVTQARRKEQEHILLTSPMNRIVFIKRVCLYASTNIKRVAELSFTNRAFMEAIRLYNDHDVWSKLVRSPFSIRSLATKFDTTARMAQQYHHQQQHQDHVLAKTGPYAGSLKDHSLAHLDAGTKILFALCSWHHDIAWLIECLVRFAGVDPNQKNSQGWSPLCFAAFNGLAESVQVLVRFGAKVQHETQKTDCRLAHLVLPSRSPLHFAALNHHVRVVEFLLRAGADANGRPCTDDSPAVIAAKHGGDDGIEILKLLLAAGADMTLASGPQGLTPARAAVLNHRFEVTSFLCEHCGL